MKQEFELINTRVKRTMKKLLTISSLLITFILPPKLLFAQSNLGISIEALGYIAQIENKYLDSSTSSESSFENDYGFSIPFTFKIADNYSLSTIRIYFRKFICWTSYYYYRELRIRK